ncbi:glucokinase [Amycolatopsis sacchari]|uniref:Glucokinase n=1 Tax=Amycolatopsis sacchari TaxID=115433 RepID=A0A1I3P2M0_9PSEU|nr:ROK family protein [Amycolatopsis sacchari]SFJ15580.1 glucokinase [Amycolatopsis sacchari]
MSEEVLGIDFGGTKVAVGVADRAGNLVRQARLDTEAELGAGQVVSRALAAARDLLDGTEPAAVGVVSPGIVLPDRILLAPNVPGWEDLRLPELVAAEFAAPVTVGTDVKAAGLAEVRWGALAGADPAVFLSLGTGIAAAIVVGGQVLAGANGAAGEIGYHLVDGADEGFASGAAPLEEAVGGRGLGLRASAALGRPVTAAELFTLARRDPAAKELVSRALDELSRHVANLAITLDPRRIAVGGGLAGSNDVILPALRERLAQAVPFPPEVVAARFPHDGALRGAIALAG